jgi:hypothetical protein
MGGVNSPVLKPIHVRALASRNLDLVATTAQSRSPSCQCPHRAALHGVVTGTQEFFQ